MGRKALEKGPLQVARLKETGLHFVGGVDGLALQVLPTGGRTWVLRMMVGDKRRSMGMGGYPDVTLAQARESARQARAKVRLGIDPIEEAKASKSLLKAAQASAITFKQCATAYIEAKEGEWNNDKHGQQWRNTLETYVFPVVGSLQVRDVALSHVTAILEPIWKTKTVTASRLRGRIESVLNWAATHGYRAGENPARWRGHLENLFAAPNKIKGEEHYPAIPVSQMGEFMNDLKARQGMGAKALQFTALTASRSGEVRGAVWSEIDLDAKLWTVPASRMKGKVMHRKPLSDAAVELLRSVDRIAGSDLVFTSPRGGALSDMTLSKLMQRMAYPDKAGRICVPHGLRSTFRDWAGENTAYPSEVIESALAHGITDKTEAAYFRSELLEKRRRLMEEWAKYCAMGKSTGSVVPINRAVQG